MSQYITLIGAEEVARAGSNMMAAASGMVSAAESISYSMQQNQQFMDDWLLRLEEVLKPQAPA